MAEAGHSYTFGFAAAGVCSSCGSGDHWSLHCPRKARYAPEEEVSEGAR